jgi:hypothetical protein
VGAYIDYALNLRSDANIVAFYNTLQKDELVFGVSGYAGKKFSEFIAECWAEYMTNPTPRVIAQKMGDMIVDRYRQIYGP